jgi:hypothetical protein
MDSWLTASDVWYYLQEAEVGHWLKGNVCEVSVAINNSDGIGIRSCKFVIRDLSSGDMVSVDTKEFGTEFELVKRRDASLEIPSASLSASSPVSSPVSSSFLQLRDLTHLTHLNEPEVLECLQKRFQAAAMYTSTGPILLAVNPFQDLPGNYSAALLDQYFQEGQGGGGRTQQHSRRTSTRPATAPTTACLSTVFRRRSVRTSLFW